jgi:hypothetical protein
MSVFERGMVVSCDPTNSACCRSISLDTWQREWVSSMASKGNAAVNAEYEAAVGYACGSSVCVLTCVCVCVCVSVLHFPPPNTALQAAEDHQPSH